MSLVMVLAFIAVLGIGIAIADSRRTAKTQDEARRAQATGFLQSELTRLTEMVADDRRRYDELLEKYHAVVSRPAEPAGPVQTIPASVADVLGPLTLSALAAMGQGQARVTREAMRAEALKLHAMKMNDEHIATAVYKGETVL